MKLHYLVEIDTNAPEGKREGVDRSVARSLHFGFPGMFRLARVDERDMGSWVARREILFDPVIDDGNEPPGYVSPITEQSRGIRRCPECGSTTRHAPSCRGSAPQENQPPLLFAECAAAGCTSRAAYRGEPELAERGWAHWPKLGWICPDCLDEAKHRTLRGEFGNR